MITDKTSRAGDQKTTRRLGHAASQISDFHQGKPDQYSPATINPHIH